MKIFKALILLLLLQGCSFDDKTGIWKNDKIIIEDKQNDIFREFKSLSSSNKPFNEIVSIPKNFKFKLEKLTNNFSWKQNFYNENNNLGNFQYNNSGEFILKSKKLSRHKINNILFSDNLFISSDNRGNIITYSPNSEILREYNFYKKKYKNLKKTLNLIIKDNIVYVTDNIGYLYAFDFKEQKVIWAKNYKIPFRSNLKIFNDKLIASNQNNNLYFFDIKTGDILRLIPTDERLVVNQFKSSLSINQKILFFLNTYGTLYSIDLESLRINWFYNLNTFSEINPSNLFNAREIISTKDNVIVSTNQFTYIIDSFNGSIRFKKNFSSKNNLIVLNDYLFLITSNDLLISMNLKNGGILYSQNIKKKIFNSTKDKKNSETKKLALVNNNIYFFLKNSNLLKVSLQGDFQNITKLPSMLNSDPIFLNRSLIYLDKKNKLVFMN